MSAHVPLSPPIAAAGAIALSQLETGPPLANRKDPGTGNFVKDATPGQRRRALWFCGVMFACSLALLPFARLHLDPQPAFFPAHQTALLGACLVTCYLLFSHFTATRVVALLYVSAAYFYTACVLFMQALSFKGLTASGQQLLGGPQTTIWLWFFWHLAPVVSVLLVTKAGLESQTREEVSGSVLRTGCWLLASIVATATLVFGFEKTLPVMDASGDFNHISSSGLAPALELLLFVALAALWHAGRFRKVLHVWLGVVVVALICDNALTMMAGSRNTLGWYAGRMGALVAFSVLAVAYLRELGNSYARSVAMADQLSFSVSSLDSQLLDEARHVEALLEADHRKDEFILVLAHELRGPLAPMQMAAELLSSGKSDEVSLRETSAVLGRQVKHMSNLVDDLMDLSRLAKGNFLSLATAPVDLLEVVAASAEQSAPLIKTRRHELVRELPARPVLVMGDRMRLVQVVTNILNNAAKYTAPGGRILLALQRSDDQVTLTVTDTGIGMSADLVKRAFDLFSQGARTSAAQGGLGIGLSLVKSLMELHHGQVTAASPGPGLGSKFTLTFPPARESAQAL